MICNVNLSEKCYTLSSKGVQALGYSSSWVQMHITSLTLDKACPWAVLSENVMILFTSQLFSGLNNICEMPSTVPDILENSSLYALLVKVDNFHVVLHL